MACQFIRSQATLQFANNTKHQYRANMQPMQKSRLQFSLSQDFDETFLMSFIKWAPEVVTVSTICRKAFGSCNFLKLRAHLSRRFYFQVAFYLVGKINLLEGFNETFSVTGIKCPAEMVTVSTFCRKQFGSCNFSKLQAHLS